jgi:hypothetical protein
MGIVELLVLGLGLLFVFRGGPRTPLYLLSRVLIALGMYGVLGSLLLIAFTGSYNSTVGRLSDEYEGQPGRSRTKWKDQRSSDLIRLAVSGGALLIGVILFTSARRAPTAREG